MKISRIEVYQKDLPYSEGEYRLSSGRSYKSFDATIVRIITQCGIEGWGESTPFGSNYIAAHGAGVRAGIECMAQALIGRDPRAYERINALMDQTLCGHNHAKTPIDVACWDIFGKSLEMPVHQLLGGSTEQFMPRISSIHSGTASDMKQRVANYRQRGYAGHSIKIGTPQNQGGAQEDAKRIIECLSDARPEEYFLVDANGGLTPEHALRVLALLPDGLDFTLEAPCASWREHMSVRQQCKHPMVLDELADDEASIIQAINDNAADGIGLKISKNGGLTRCRRQRDIAIAAGLTMSVQDTVGSTISFAAIVQLAQTIDQRFLRCILDTRDMVTEQLADIDVEFKDGLIRASNRPGLGIDVWQAQLGKPVAIYQ